MAIPLRSDGEVDKHYAVLLHDANQQDHSNDSNHGQIHPSRIKGQQCADPGGRQCRQNRQRMNEALVKNSEDDIDHDKRCKNEHGRAR
jgi:hypothetical protein